MEEDEENLSEWYSTKTSHGAQEMSARNMGAHHGNHEGSTGARRQGSLGRSDSPLKIVEFHPKDGTGGAIETDSAGDSSLR